jgi:hypothetical protein
MESRRKKLIIAVASLAVLILLAVLAWFLWLRPAAPATPAASEPGAPSASGQLPKTGALPSQPAPGQEAVAGQPTTAVPAVSPAAALPRLASTFTERYGSYSSAGDFQNLLDLAPMMTDRLKGETETYIEAERQKTPSGEDFFGVTTRALSPVLITFDDGGGTALVAVDTVRSERLSGGRDATPYYQKLAVFLLKVNGQWQVDKAIWEQEKRARQ